MKNYIKILAVFICTSLFYACEDRLVEENHSNVTSEFMKTPEGFRMGLNSVYSIMKTMYGYEEGIWGLMVPGTDEIECNEGSSGRYAPLSQYDREKYNTDNEYPRKLWTDAYLAINTLNYLIENAGTINVSTSTLTPAQRDQYVGEAKFFRGFFYFYLVQQFGDVTLTTTYNDKPSTSADRHDMVSVYEQIIKDLEDASAACSPSPQQNNLESGRASGAAARHLLAKAYLTLGWVHDKSSGQYPNDPHSKYYNQGKAQEYYQKALATSSKLITDAPSLGLRLMPVFADVFAEANDAPSLNNKEALFVARMDWDDNNVYGSTSTINHYFVNGYDAILGERNLQDGRCYSWCHPTSYALNVFDNRDKDTRYEGTFQTVWRATKTNGNDNSAVAYIIDGINETFNWKLTKTGDTALYYPGYKMTAAEIRDRVQKHVDAGGNRYVIYTPDAYNGRAIFPTITKFLDRTKTDFNSSSDRSFIVFRLAETYLLAAEAAFKLGNNSEAAKYVNEIRERARNKNTTTAGALNVGANDITLNFLLEERTRELLAEHHRWTDLARTGTLMDRIVRLSYFNDAADNSGRGKPSINIEGMNKFILRPIPKVQVEAVTAGVPYPQNPNW